MDRVARFHSLLLHIFRVLLIKRNFILLSKAQGNERLPVFQKTGPLWKQTPISRVLAYPLGSPVEKPSLQLPFIELPKREMLRFQRPASFIFQSPWYMSPLPGSPAESLWREMPVSRAFLYITLRVPSKEPPPLQVSLTELQQREMLHFQRSPSSVSQSPW
jgi:hypothetical protein